MQFYSSQTSLNYKPHFTVLCYLFSSGVRNLSCEEVIKLIEIDCSLRMLAWAGFDVMTDNSIVVAG